MVVKAWSISFLKSSSAFSYFVFSVYQLKIEVNAFYSRKRTEIGGSVVDNSSCPVNAGIFLIGYFNNREGFSVFKIYIVAGFPLF